MYLSLGFKNIFHYMSSVVSQQVDLYIISLQGLYLLVSYSFYKQGVVPNYSLSCVTLLNGRGLAVIKTGWGVEGISLIQPNGAKNTQSPSV